MAYQVTDVSDLYSTAGDVLARKGEIMEELPPLLRRSAPSLIEAGLLIRMLSPKSLGAVAPPPAPAAPSNEGGEA